MLGSPKTFCVMVLTRLGPSALPIVNMNRKVDVILARILLGTMAWKAAFCGPVPMPMTQVLSVASASATHGLDTRANVTANGMCASEAHNTTR
jgi:hypothetical protein